MSRPSPPPASAATAQRSTRRGGIIVGAVAMCFTLLVLLPGHGFDAPGRDHTISTTPTLHRPPPPHFTAGDGEDVRLTFAPVDVTDPPPSSEGHPPPTALSLASLFHRPASLTGTVARTIPGEELSDFKQIHHGIYRCRGAKSNITFALKTECRPAQKWHGQQGWTEVAVHHFSRLFFGPDGRNSVPPAAGMVVLLNAQQKALVHKDGCGLTLGPAQLGIRGPIRRLLEQLGHDQLYPLFGVALEWRSAHSDEGLAVIEGRPEVSRGWDVASLKESYLSSKPDEVKETLKQISDVMVLDYIVANEDREDKNWFTVPAAAVAADTGKQPKKGKGSPAALSAVRFVAMDNGWAFIGRGYKTSICDLDLPNLRCPPLLRRLSHTSTCRSKAAVGGGPSAPRSPVAQNCRFRKATVERLRSILGEGLDAVDLAEGHPGLAHAVPHTELQAFAFGTGPWGTAFLPELFEILRRDPLFAWLVEQYGTSVESKFDGMQDRHGTQFSTALARFLQRCPVPQPNATALHLAHPAQPYHFLGSRDVPPNGPMDMLLDWLAFGMTQRMKALLQHADECVADLGAAVVFME